MKLRRDKLPEARHQPSPKATARQAWPKTRTAFWRKKIEGNRTRDRLVGRELRRAGWTVLRIWEHELRRRDETKLIRRLQKLLPA